MQREGHLGLQNGTPLQQRAQLEDTREGHLSLQHGPPLQQRAQLEDPRFPQRDHTFPHAAPFQGVNYLDERSHPCSSAHNWKTRAKATSACSMGHPCNSAHSWKTRVSPSATTPSRTPRHSKGSTTSTSEVPWRHICK